MTELSQTETWVTAAQRGDRLALSKLLTTYHPQLRAWTAARMDAPMKARSGPEDILQQVYFDVAQQIERFDNRGPGAFLSWVQTILDHKLVDARRAAHCQARDVNREVPAVAGSGSSSYWNLLDDLYAGSGTPSREVRREEALSALLMCVSNLSESHRQVIQLRFLEGLPLEEVAARLGKSKAAVVALSKRALEALRTSMDRMGEFTHGA